MIKKVTILGVDPGFDRLGWAVGTYLDQHWQHLNYGCINTNKDLSLTQRYHQVIKQLDKILAKYQPDQAAIETVFFSNNRKTAMKVSEIKGVILASCISHQLEIYEYNPNQIKQAVTGNGRAGKQAVEKMVRLELKLKQPKIIDDTIDALAVMMTHAANLKLLKSYA